MREGWCNDDYWSLCESQDEAEHLTSVYGLTDFLPGYTFVGLKGWDDFIVADRAGHYFLIPTVPLDRAYLAPFCFPKDSLSLEQDDRFTGKIKWYVKPIRFGGDPGAEENMTWLSQEQHAEAVKWWTKLFYGQPSEQPPA
jgi:hypothetical protein